MGETFWQIIDGGQAWMCAMVAGLAVGATGCTVGDSARQCDRTSECRVGEVCSSGVCKERSESIPPSPIRDARVSGDDDDPPPDMGMAVDGGDITESSADVDDGGDIGGGDAQPDGQGKMYPDCDGDGFGSDAPWAPVCDSPAKVPNAEDCNDTDPQVPVTENLGWYGTPHTDGNGDESFDYDCDGNEAKRFTTKGVCRDVSGACKVTQPGWLGTVPSCGTSETFVRDPEDCMSVTSTCKPRVDAPQQEQQCR